MRLLRGAVSLLVVSVAAWGGQSLSIASTGTVTYPSAAPWTAIGSWTGSLRVSGVVTPGTFRFFYQGPAVSVFLSAEQEICANNLLDSHATGNRMCADITGIADVSITWQRDTAAMQWRLFAWDVSTGAPLTTWCGSRAGGTSGNVRNFCAITALSGSAAGVGNFGGSGTGAANVAWIKMLPGLGQTNQPYQQYDTASLWDVRLEGNGTDQSGRGLNLAISGANYFTTPPFGPVAVISTSQTVGQTPISLRAGATNTLSAAQSYSRGDTATLTYRWSQIGGPSRLIWGSQTTVDPTVTGAVFGTYRFALTVVDDAGLSSSTTLELGAVAMDSNGVVINADPRVDELLGPLIAFGRNPWPWADDRHKYLSEFFGDKLDTDPDFADTWNQPLAGTISVTNGSTAVTGVGTNFTSSYACNGSDRIVIHYPRSTGGTGRFAATIASCASATSLTLAFPYTRSATASGLNYSTYPNANEFFYANGQNNANYYDNVLAHYALYFRSGNVKYRDYARKLAYRWWTSPSMDRGLSGLLPRLLSPVGLVTCMVVDDCASYNPVFQSFWDDYGAGLENWEIFVRNDLWPGDGREESYRALTHSLGARYHTDAAKRTRYLGDIVTGLAAKFSPRQQPSGTIYTPLETPGATNVDVTSGSPVVTARAGFTFTSGFCAPSTFTPLVIFATSTWESVAYTCTFNSSSQITLDRAYVGATGARTARSSNLVGQGTQPFILGVFANYFRFHNLATNTTAANNLLLGTTDWLTNFGLQPANKGLYYGREFPGCEPPTALVNCLNGGTDIGDDGARFFAAETLGAWSWSYLAAPTTARRDRADLHYGANFGKLGGPQTAEGWFYGDFEDNGFVVNTRKAKDFGFAFGFGFASTWPAARLGGVAAPDTRTVTISLAIPAGATGASVRAIAPSGSDSTVACTVSGAFASCPVSVDYRQVSGSSGSYLMQTTYTFSGGRQAIGDVQPLRLR